MESVPPLAGPAALAAVPARSDRWRARTVDAFVVLTCLCVFVPFLPSMPRDGLDGSWVMGLNEAMRQGLPFGERIVMAFGPYASVYTTAYSEATDTLMLCASLVLGIAYASCLLFLDRRSSWIATVVLCFGLASLVHLRDNLFLSYPLLLAIVVYRHVEGSRGPIAWGARGQVGCASLFVPLGLLPLINGNLLIPCATTVACIVAYLASRRRRVLAVAAIVVPLVAMVVFWTASGQPVTGLGGYLAALYPIVTGYTEAMATWGPAVEPVAYLVGGAFLIVYLMTHKPVDRAGSVFLSTTFFLYLFIAFKGGFVRHDGHALLAGTALLLAALFLFFLSFDRRVVTPLLCCLVVWSFIESHYVIVTPGATVTKFLATFTDAAEGLVRRVSGRHGLQAEHGRALAGIKAAANLPEMIGTTDVYDNGQAMLIGSGNRWNPRPTFQSYAAYTPGLLAANADHLKGSDAPDHVAMRLDPIDGRLPSTEDGLSWRSILERYVPVAYAGGTLVLDRRAMPPSIASPSPRSTVIHASLDERVVVPTSEGLTFARIEVRSTLVGKLAAFFFKPARLMIRIETEGGAPREFRVVANMIDSPFLLSPLIEDSFEFGRLYGRRDLLRKKTVRAFTLTSDGVDHTTWNDDYVVTFETDRQPAPIALPPSLALDPFLPANAKLATAPACDGSIDTLEGGSAAARAVVASGTLSVSGWASTSAASGVLPDAVYATLTDAAGTTSVSKAHRTKRIDVATAFNRVALADAGFAVLADVSALQGSFTLGLAVEEGGTLRQCPQFAIPLTIR